MSSKDGINKLMEAEQEAQKIIAAARADKKANMIRAQVEAELEIKQYQKIKMEEYEAMKEQKSGLDDSGQKLLADSQKEVEGLKQGYEQNKGACVKLLTTAVSSGLL